MTNKWVTQQELIDMGMPPADAARNWSGVTREEAEVEWARIQAARAKFAEEQRERDRLEKIAFRAFLESIPGRPEKPLWSMLTDVGGFGGQSYILGLLIGGDGSEDLAGNEEFPRVWKTVGDKLTVLIGDEGNGWCHIIEIWENQDHASI